jgi:Protein of unknown function (DUF2934)
MASEHDNDWNGQDEQPREMNGITNPADEEIAQRAYELYLARGGTDGHDLEDWLEARRQLEDPGDRDVIAHS